MAFVHKKSAPENEDFNAKRKHHHKAASNACTGREDEATHAQAERADQAKRVAALYQHDRTVV